ncbi:hypothetical protein B0H19DRAFT_1197606 [Mycena capillaripes]|nr:hypothetical protein B0H19DRAFT_1197606 [Mycena capillaripes]
MHMLVRCTHSSVRELPTLILCRCCIYLMLSSVILRPRLRAPRSAQGALICIQTQKATVECLSCTVGLPTGARTQKSHPSGTDMHERRTYPMVRQTLPKTLRIRPTPARTRTPAHHLPQAACVHLPNLHLPRRAPRISRGHIPVADSASAPHTELYTHHSRVPRFRREDVRCEVDVQLPHSTVQHQGRDMSTYTRDPCATPRLHTRRARRIASTTDTGIAPAPARPHPRAASSSGKILCSAHPIASHT